MTINTYINYIQIKKSKVKLKQRPYIKQKIPKHNCAYKK